MTNKQQKLLQELQKAKFREKFGFFVVEGTKMVRELCQEIPEQIAWIAATPEWISENKAYLRKPSYPIIETTEPVLKANSSLQTSPLAIAVVKQKIAQVPDSQNLTGISLFLETIQDPGNMGTIIRTADWFGIQHIFVTADCVDIYNPKVVQASMSSIWRVNVHIIQHTAAFFREYHTIPVYGAVLGGHDLYTTRLSKPAFLAMGNESKGISTDLLPFLNHKITIPRFGQAESLNVAIATGILLSHFKQAELGM
jgi:TrmH family RNA methyltransferase